MNVWEQFEPEERDFRYELLYLEFDLKFGTKIGPNSAITEPRPSVTYDIATAFSGEQVKFELLEENLNSKALAAFKSCVRPSEELYALQAGYKDYRFYPHRKFKDDEASAWLVKLLPTETYSIFVSNDFRFGIFVRPWEQSLCVFGQRLMDAFEIHKPALFKKIIRTA